MRTLYPRIEPFAIHELKAGEIHTLYVEESGNPQGIPVVFIHGGPGSGCKPYHRQFFDPQRYRVIVFDQRGCNRSTPRGETRANTTHDLIADMELIRSTLNIERWLLFGGSWGATLALLYAQIHPQRVSGIIVRGTFLARERDLSWFVSEGVNRIFPDYWDEFATHIPADERRDLIVAYHRRVHGADPRVRHAAAQHWSSWAGRVVTYLLPQGQAVESGDPATTLDEVSIETHYALNRYFIEPDQILRDVRRIPDVPVVIIHGRRDLTCTVEAAWELHRALPGSRFTVLPESGHLAAEPGMIDALVTATEDMAGELR